MSRDLTLSARLMLEHQQWQRGLNQAQGGMRGFVSNVGREVAQLRRALGTVPGMLASIGAGYSALDSIRKSANLDQSLTRIGQSANASREEIAGMRRELMAMARETGREVEELQSGLDVLIAGNLAPKTATTVLREINKEARITGASMDVLGKALMVMSTNFGTNLNSGTEVTRMLEKMTVAGRQGFVELENLSDVIPRVAVHAKNAGMSDVTMLAYLETLSNAEQDPARLSTLAESSLRLFNNPQYRKAVTKSTGVKFTDENDQLRPVSDILTDLQGSYSKLTTGGQRQRWAGEVFGQMDITTQTGVLSMLDKRMLGTMAENERAIAASGGQISRDFGGSLDNSVVQTAILRATMRESLDELSMPINRALTSSIQFALGKDGLDLSGGEVLGYGAAGGAGAYALSRSLPPAIAKLFGNTASLGSGVVMGDALQKAGVATPVFIVGAAPGLLGGDGSTMVLPGVGSGAGNGGKPRPKTVGDLLRRRIAQLGASASSALQVAALPVGISIYGGDAGGDYAAALQRGEPAPDGFRGWMGGVVDRGAGLSASADFMRQYRQKVDLNISVKDDRVSVAVDGSSGGGNVSTRTGPSTRYRPRTGRIMAGGTP